MTKGKNGKASKAKKKAAKPIKAAKKTKKAKDEEEDGEEVDPESKLPGQKYSTPPEGDELRIFYETLYQQKPTSKMAEKWCLEYGVLSYEKANELFNKMKKKK